MLLATSFTRRSDDESRGQGGIWRRISLILAEAGGWVGVQPRPWFRLGQHSRRGAAQAVLRSPAADGDRRLGACGHSTACKRHLSFRSIRAIDNLDNLAGVTCACVALSPDVEVRWSLVGPTMHCSRVYTNCAALELGSKSLSPWARSKPRISFTQDGG